MSETVTWSDPCDTVTTTSGNVVVEASCPGAGVPPSGAASGDLSGTYPSPGVAKLVSVAIQIGTPTNGDALVYESAGPQWAHKPIQTVLPASGMIPFSGKYASGQMTGAGMNAVSCLTGFAHCTPYYKTYDMVTSAMGIGVTAIGLGNARIAIYASDVNTGAPTGTPLWQSADISVASTGMREEAVTYTLNRHTQYWFGLMTNVNIGGVRGWAVADDEGLFPSDPSSLLTVLTSIKRAVTYGTWPDFSASPPLFADFVSTSSHGIFAKRA